MNRVSDYSGRKSLVDWEVTRSSPMPINGSNNSNRSSNFPTINLVLPTVDGYTVSHSLLIDNLPTDSYGFILDERHGIPISSYREFERRYARKVERQVQRWNALVPLAKEDLVVFPPASDKVKHALRKGLPKELRPKAWFFYSGAQARQDAEPKRYVELVKIAMQNSHSPLHNQIDSEVSHTFANNRRFRSFNITSPFTTETDTMSSTNDSKSQAALKRILLAVAYAFPNVSYTSGLNSIAAALLLTTEHEQRSFWILYSILSDLLPTNYYTEMNLGCNVYQDILAALISWKLPNVHKKLQELEMSLHIVTSSWLTHLFADQLPFETLLRVLDAFLFEGPKVLLRISLALFKIHQEELMRINDPFELATFIRKMPKLQLDVSFLMKTAFNGIGGLPSAWIEEEREKALPFWKAKHAVRRFSRVSPAYCQASVYHEQHQSQPQPQQHRDNPFAAPAVQVSVTPLSLRPAQAHLKVVLEDATNIFENVE